MLFNMDKRHVLHTGRHNQQFDYVWVGGVLEVAKAEKDVGVMVTSYHKPSVQCARVAKKANMVLGQLARSVSYRDNKFNSIKISGSGMSISGSEKIISGSGKIISGSGKSISGSGKIISGSKKIIGGSE